MRRERLLSLAAAVLLCGGAADSSAQTASLTAMDYVQIRQLGARFTHALDSAANKGYALADLFTPDGELVRPDARGREAIAAVSRGDARRGPAHITLYAMNHVIEPTADGAIGRQYVVEMTFPEAAAGGRGRQGQAGTPVSQWDLVGRVGGELVASGGRYEDVYAKTPDGWRFKRREFIPGGQASAAARSAAGRVPGPPPRAAADAPPAAGALTASDYLQIEQLVASYGHALDSGFNSADNGDAYANLFVPEVGTFFSRGRPVQGHAALAELARAQPHAPNYVRHYLTNHVIDSAADGRVTGRQYLVVIDVGENGKPSTLFLGGYYEDVYQKTPAGWKFLERRSFGARAGA